jgi:DNA-binding MarR family transcriptional regulator
LRNLWSRFEAEVAAGIAERYDGMTPATNRIMILIDREGTRIGELARRAGVAKQSMAEATAQLEERGLVRREDDPDDRRAKRVVLTPAGAEALRVGRLVAEGVHDRWEAVLGEQKMARLVAMLEELDIGLRD